MPALTVQLDAKAPVTLEEAKAWAKANMNASPEDDLFALLINSAFENVEDELNLELVTRGTIVEEHDILRLNQYEIWTLQRPILSTPTIVVHNDPNRQFGAGTIVPASELIVDTERGKITRVASGGSFPAFFTSGYGTVRVTYASGYADAASVPAKLKSLVLETAASYFYHLGEKGFNVRGFSDEQGNRTFIEFDFIPKPVMRKLEKHKKKFFGRVRARRVSVT